MKKLILSLNALLLMTGVNAQTPGDLDVNFGVGGYTMTDPYSNTGELYYKVITLSDDKIVKVGFTDDGGDSDILVAKFLADGTPDVNFGSNGFLTIDLSLGGDEDARGVFESAGGTLLITGYVQKVGGYDGYVLKLNADGSIDNSFGASSGHTKFNTGNNTVAVGTDVLEYGGEIYVGATALVLNQPDICVFNFTSGGMLDASFSTGGVGVMDLGGQEQLSSMAVTFGGAFIMGGFTIQNGVKSGFIASLSQFGTPTTFAGGGSYTFDLGSGQNEINDVIVDAAGNIVAVGDEGIFPNVNGFILRLDNTGALDLGFGTDGFASSDPGASTALFLRGVMETADNGYVAVGNFDGASKDIYAMLVNASGNFNSNFGGNGDVIIPFSISVNTVSAAGGALQSDGAIIIGGSLTSQDFSGSNMFMLRLFPYINSSSIDELNQELISVYPNPANSEFKIDMENIQEVQMISQNGEVVKTWEAQSIYDVPASITPGVYLIRAVTPSSFGIARLMIK